MAATLLPVVLSGIGTLAGKYFQDRAAKIKQQQEHIKQLIPKVDSALNSVSSNMDRLSYLADQAMYSLVFRGETYSKKSETEKKHGTEGTAWDHYIESLVEWETQKTSNLGKVKTYFGEEMSEALEKIQKGFDNIDHFLKATYFERTTSKYFLEDKKSKNDFRTKYFSCKRALDNDIKTLNSKMIEASNKLNLQDS